MAIAVNDARAIGPLMTVDRIAISDRIRLPQAPGQSLFRNWFSLLLFGILLCGSADLISGHSRRSKASGKYDELVIVHRSRWRLVGSQKVFDGQEQFVLVEKASQANREIYNNAIEHLCPVDKWCGLYFWSDSSLIPNRLPMSDRQIAAEVANYTRNPDTGFAQFLWNCHVNHDPLNCFALE